MLGRNTVRRCPQNAEIEAKPTKITLNSAKVGEHRKKSTEIVLINFRDIKAGRGEVETSTALKIANFDFALGNVHFTVILPCKNPNETKNRFMKL